MIPTPSSTPKWYRTCERVYRGPDSYAPLGRGGIVISLLLTCGAIAVPWLEASGSSLSRFLLAAMGALVFGAFGAASFSLLLTGERSSLETSAKQIRLAGVFQTTTIPLSEITRAVWSGFPRGGRIVLYTNTGRSSIWIGDYTRSLELSAFFRTALRADVQQHYERFEAAYVPTSAAFHRLQDRQARGFVAVLPIVVITLFVMVFWDPYELRAVCAGPLAIMGFLGVRSLLSRWRRPRVWGHA